MRLSSAAFAAQVAHLRAESERGEAFAVLLEAWPLPAGSRIGTVPGEYGGNARLLARLAVGRGWQLVVLPFDAQGRSTAGCAAYVGTSRTWLCGPRGGGRGRRGGVAGRGLLDGAGGWRVRDELDAPGGITTLTGGDPAATRARLGGAGAPGAPRGRPRPLGSVR